MKKMKKMVSMLLVFCLCCCLVVGVASASSATVNKTGSDTVTSSAVGLEKTARFSATANKNSPGIMSVRGQASVPGQSYTTVASFNLNAGSSGSQTATRSQASAFRIQLVGTGTGSGSVSSPA